MIIGIDVVFIHSKDPERLVEWYRDKLGIELGYSDSNWNEFVFDLGRPPTRFAIEGVGDDPSKTEAQRIMISLRVTDVKEAVDTLEEKGVQFYGTPKIRDEGPSLFATLRDPEGNWIQLSQRKRADV
ncbi:MAG: VOC family protein [Candidatus Thorarchaeota archaeon]|jgi:catechol 2,3-dioxygenase-like lactoylglutathione lyase family enzyme